MTSGTQLSILFPDITETLNPYQEGLLSSLRGMQPRWTDAEARSWLTLYTTWLEQDSTNPATRIEIEGIHHAD